MKRLIHVLATAMFTSLVCGCATVAGESDLPEFRQGALTINAETVLAAHNAFLEAMQQGDTERLAELMDDDIQWIHGSGRIETKDEMLATVRRGRLQDLSVAYREETVRTKGDVALLSGIATISAMIDGNPRKMEHRFTAIWSGFEGQPKMLNWQPTVIDDGR